MADAQLTVQHFAALVGELGTALAVARAERDTAQERLALYEARDRMHAEPDPEADPATDAPATGPTSN